MMLSVKPGIGTTTLKNLKQCIWNSMGLLGWLADMLGGKPGIGTTTLKR